MCTTMANHTYKEQKLLSVEWFAASVLLLIQAISEALPNLGFSRVNKMTALTAEALQVWKDANPDDAKLQALSLADLEEKLKETPVDWSTLELPKDDSELLQGSTMDCVLGVGYVVFDCVCLMIGAVAIRGSLNPTSAKAVGKAAQPVMNALEKYIAALSKEGATTASKAGAVFNIMSTIWSGGCLGAVFAAVMESLEWYTAALYAVTGMGTILAALATDGVATIGLIAVELATFGFLVSDSINCVTACDFSD